MDSKGKIVGVAAVLLVLVVPLIIWINAGFSPMLTYLFFLFAIPGGIITVMDLIEVIKTRNFHGPRMIKIVLVVFLVAFIIAMAMFPSTKNVAGLGLIGLPFLLWWQPER